MSTYFEENTLDDLLHTVFEKLLAQEEVVEATRSEELGGFTEIFGAMLVLKNPRARISRSESKGKIFSALGELFWYLSQSNDLSFIQYYLSTYHKESDDGIDVRSGYGKRLFQHNGTNQFENIINILSARKSSRRAVIQLFDASDLIENYKSIPCTCTLQFLIRNNKLNMLVSMRSNDAFLGLAHDVFNFTMIQEIVARTIGVELGMYKHCVGSLHLYEAHRSAAQSYINEAWQDTVAMPPMPVENPWKAIEATRKIEKSIREGESVDWGMVELTNYWLDICRLLYIFRLFNKEGNREKAVNVRDLLSDKTYHMFVNDKL